MSKRKGKQRDFTKKKRKKKFFANISFEAMFLGVYAKQRFRNKFHLTANESFSALTYHVRIVQLNFLIFIVAISFVNEKKNNI